LYMVSILPVGFQASGRGGEPVAFRCHETDSGEFYPKEPGRFRRSEIVCRMPGNEMSCGGHADGGPAMEVPGAQSEVVVQTAVRQRYPHPGGDPLRHDR